MFPYVFCITYLETVLRGEKHGACFLQARGVFQKCVPLALIGALGSFIQQLNCVRFSTLCRL